MGHKRLVLCATIVAFGRPLSRNELGANVAGEVAAVHKDGVHRAHHAHLALDLALQLLYFLCAFLYFLEEEADPGR